MTKASETDQRQEEAKGKGPAYVNDGEACGMLAHVVIAWSLKRAAGIVTSSHRFYLQFLPVLTEITRFAELNSKSASMFVFDYVGASH